MRTAIYKIYFTMKWVLKGCEPREQKGSHGKKKLDVPNESAAIPDL